LPKNIKPSKVNPPKKKPSKKGSKSLFVLKWVIPSAVLLLTAVCAYYAYHASCQNDEMLRESRESKASGSLVYSVQPLYVGKIKYDYYTFYLKNISTGESLKVKNIYIEFTETINRDFSNVDIHNDLNIQPLIDGNQVSIPTKNLEISPGFDYPFCFFVLSGGSIKSVAIESKNARKISEAHLMTDSEIKEELKSNGGPK
jgi:hypothetical protein